MIYLRTFAAVLLLLLSWPSAALTAGEFVAICESARKPCVEHPLLQAYVGGALDLIAMLDEQTDYLTPVYCKPPEELFDVSAIIRFVEVHAADNESTNAMLLVIRFLEERGGCAQSRTTGNAMPRQHASRPSPAGKSLA